MCESPRHHYGQPRWGNAYENDAFPVTWHVSPALADQAARRMANHGVKRVLRIKCRFKTSRYIGGDNRAFCRMQQDFAWYRQQEQNMQ